MNNQLQTRCHCCEISLERQTARGPVYIQSPIVIDDQQYVLCHSCQKAAEWATQRIIAAIKNALDALPGKVSANQNVQDHDNTIYQGEQSLDPKLVEWKKRMEEELG